MVRKYSLKLNPDIFPLRHDCEIDGFYVTNRKITPVLIQDLHLNPFFLIS